MERPEALEKPDFAELLDGGRLRLVVPDWIGQDRLDRALSRMLPALSRSHLKRMIKQGLCRVNDQVAVPATPVRPGDVVELERVEKPPPPCKPQPGPLQVLLDDAHVLVVNKPAGVATHPSKGHGSGTLLNWVVHYLWNEIQSGWSRPHCVGRLDLGTSGLVIIAKTARAMRHFQREIDAGRLSRRYIGLVWGRPPDRGTVDMPIKPGPGGKMVASADGKPATTEFVVCRAFTLPTLAEWREGTDTISVIHAAIQTGRTHQIRVHMKYLGHPVLGEDLYKSARFDCPPDHELKRLIDALGGYALHAREVRFNHPADGRPVRVAAPPPDPFLELLRYLHRAERG